MNLVQFVKYVTYVLKHLTLRMYTIRMPVGVCHKHGPHIRTFIGRHTTQMAKAHRPIRTYIPYSCFRVSCLNCYWTDMHSTIADMHRVLVDPSDRVNALFNHCIHLINDKYLRQLGEETRN